MTYSIGFRAPTHQELAEQFLVYLQDRIEIAGRYADPNLAAQQHPAEISAAMLRQVEQAIKQVRWDKQDIANFLGCYLSEPKPHIFFAAPQPALSMPRFQQSVRKHGLMLDLKSQMLCHAGWVFMNGEAYKPIRQDYAVLRTLADQRELFTPPEITAASVELLYQWYLDGYILPSQARRKSRRKS